LINSLLRFFSGLRRNLRSRELLWLLLALTLTVTALSSVSFLADRMQRAFAFDARQLLASDLLIVSDQPLPNAFLEQAQQQNLQIAQTVVFPSMATVGSHSKLASLKAVSTLYPLRGALRVASATQARIPKSGPDKGLVWVDPAMLASLHAKEGDTITLGQKNFVIGGVLERELDRGAGFMNFAPRVMMSLNDLSDTGLIGLGSRVTYRLLLAGADSQIHSYEAWAQQYIDQQSLKGVRIETLENAQPLMRKTLERADRFLSLIALLTAMVASVSIALSAHRYTRKQADVCAVLKCLGASSAKILQRQGEILLGLGLIAAFLGSLLGYFGQYILTALLGNLVITDLPSPSLWPVFWSVLVAWCLLFGFAGPSIYKLIKVSPIRLIRK
jgi:putative ABC transport system permease protein